MKYRNHEGYSDPVVGAALYNIRKEERKKERIKNKEKNIKRKNVHKQK